MLLEDPRHHDGSSIPSWVPDFAKTDSLVSQNVHGKVYLYSCSEGLPFYGYQLEHTEKSIEVSAILLGGIDFLGRQYASFPEGFPEIRDTFLPGSSNDSLQFLQPMTKGISDAQSCMEPRDDIEDILKKNSSIWLPSGLTSEATAEVLFQNGIFLDQTAGTLGAPSKRRLYQAEKFPGTKHAQDLITKTISAARYSRLLVQDLVPLLSLEGPDCLAAPQLQWRPKCFSQNAPRTPI